MLDVLTNSKFQQSEEEKRSTFCCNQLDLIEWCGSNVIPLLVFPKNSEELIFGVHINGTNNCINNISVLAEPRRYFDIDDIWRRKWIIKITSNDITTSYTTGLCTIYNTIKHNSNLFFREVRNNPSDLNIADTINACLRELMSKIK